MDLYARYTHPENGFDGDQETCKEHLTLGERYLVTSVDMGPSFTYIKLDGIKDIFNSVNFDFEDEDGTNHNIYTDPEYNPYM